MQCTSPKNALYDPAQKKLLFKGLNIINGQIQGSVKGFDLIRLPCNKCIACKLEKARETAIRAMHETLMHPESHSHFITLTYSEQNIGDNKLHYAHIQKFIRKLRKATNAKIKYLVCGEYGEKNGRAHWHLLLWGLDIKDLLPTRLSDSGHQLYTSKIINDLWGFNDPTECPVEIGRISIESAGYVARYTTKKTNGESFARRSTRPAIGTGWLEKYYDDIFRTGIISLGAGTDQAITSTTIPRYYRTWMEKNHPEELKYFDATIKQQRIEKAKEFDLKERDEYAKANLARGRKKGLMIKRNRSRQIILEQKFKKLKDADKL